MINTIVLAVPAITMAYIIGAILGSIAGDQRGSPLERVVVTVVTFAGSIPSFFTGIVAIIIFGVWLNLFPTGGMLEPGSTASGLSRFVSVDFLRHYILPFSATVFYVTMGPTLIMRTSYTEVTGQDFAYFQKVSGLPYYNRVKHLSRHAILPLVTLYPISLVNSISALVLVEMVFNWPGLGFALVQAINARNFPIVQFVFFTIAALVIIANFLVDLFYGVVDPRISIGDDTA
jgi:peptide/nickel transport system permease protein